MSLQSTEGFEFTYAAILTVPLYIYAIILYLNVEYFTHISISVIRQLFHLFKVFHILIMFFFIFLIFSKCYVFHEYENMPTGSYQLGVLLHSHSILYLILWQHYIISLLLLYFYMFISSLNCELPKDSGLSIFVSPVLSPGPDT